MQRRLAAGPEDLKINDLIVLANVRATLSSHSCDAAIDPTGQSVVLRGLAPTLDLTLHLAVARHPHRVISAGVDVLAALAERDGQLKFQFDHFDRGGEYCKKNGRMMPVNGSDQIIMIDLVWFSRSS